MVLIGIMFSLFIKVILLIVVILVIITAIKGLPRIKVKVEVRVAKNI
jgi:hypothetical protein